MKNKEKKESIRKKTIKEFKAKRHLVKPITIISILIILQVLLFIYLYRKVEIADPILETFWALVAFVMIIYFVNLDRPMDYKLAWLIPITLAPVFGVLLYLILEILPGPKQLKMKLERIKNSYSNILIQDEMVHEKIKNHEIIDHGLEKYISEYAKYPMYQNTDIKYLESGEIYFENLKEDLRNAKKFILMEYFILKPGKMLNEILEIFVEKISEGIEVLLMYDGSNEYHLESGYDEYLRSLGIKLVVFSAVKPILSTAHNNRDHRKIVSIDNKIGYTGGINIGDEYINHEKRFGHWKDNGMRLEGEAVTNLTTMFFYLWNLSSNEDYDIKKYVDQKYQTNSTAFVQPFDDSPNDEESVAENTYLDVLNQAKDYVYIFTPYLVPSETIDHALRFAAKRGVDVKIFLPGIEDKKIPYAVARSYYMQLINSGVKIYEYAEGFLHSKAIISDDITSVIGTINLDYRSFHLNYENGVLIYDKDFALQVKNDIIKTKEVSRRITNKEYKDLNIFYRLFGKIMRIFAPLM